MNRRFERLFIWTAAEFLFVAGVIIWLSSMKHVVVLDRPDPIIYMSNRAIFRTIGSLALLCSAYALICRNRTQAAVFIGGGAEIVLSYLLSLLWMREANLLSYIGNLNGVPISPRFLGPAMFVVLGCMAGGSGLILFFEWLISRKIAQGNSTLEVVDNQRLAWSTKAEDAATAGEASA